MIENGRNISVGQADCTDDAVAQCLNSRASTLSQPIRSERWQDLEKRSVIAFDLWDDGSYAIDSAFVAGVERVDALSILPNMPNFVVGCMHWHDSALGVIDLGSWWKKSQESRPCTVQNWIVVLSIKNNRIGLIVESIKACDHYMLKDLAELSSNEAIEHQEIVGWLPDRIAYINASGLCDNIVDSIKRAPALVRVV